MFKCEGSIKGPWVGFSPSLQDRTSTRHLIISEDIRQLVDHMARKASFDTDPPHTARMQSSCCLKVDFGPASTSISLTFLDCKLSLTLS